MRSAACVPLLRGMRWPGCQQEFDIENNNQNVEMPNEMVYTPNYSGIQVHCLFIVPFF